MMPRVNALSVIGIFFPFLSFLFLFQLFSLLYSKIQIWEMDRKG